MGRGGVQSPSKPPRPFDERRPSRTVVTDCPSLRAWIPGTLLDSDRLAAVSGARHEQVPVAYANDQISLLHP